jgi:hypothetical protein
LIRPEDVEVRWHLAMDGLIITVDGEAQLSDFRRVDLGNKIVTQIVIRDTRLDGLVGHR